MQDIRQEIAAQIGRFFTLTGLLPDHVDGHHHCHVAPPVAEALIGEMQRAGLDRVRLPKTSDDIESAADIERRFVENARCLDFYRRVQAESALAEPLYRQAGIIFPDRFCGIALMGSGMTPARLAAVLIRIATSDLACVELMCHPGHPEVTGEDFSDSPERRLESATLNAVLARATGDLWPNGLIPATFAELSPPCAR